MQEKIARAPPDNPKKNPENFSSRQDNLILPTHVYTYGLQITISLLPLTCIYFVVVVIVVVVV
jgi:hypothetical protein